MATAELAFNFSVDGPGETMDFAVATTPTLSVDTVNARSALVSSTTESIVWQHPGHGGGSSIASALPSMLIIGVEAVDGGTLTSSDIFQVSLWTTVVTSGAASVSNAFTFTMTKDSVICLPSARAKSVAPSGTPIVDAITKITACRESGSNSGRVVVKSTN